MGYTVNIKSKINHHCFIISDWFEDKHKATQWGRTVVSHASDLYFEVVDRDHDKEIDTIVEQVIREDHEREIALDDFDTGGVLK